VKNKVLALLVLLTLGLGAACAWLWNQREESRLRNTELAATVSDLNLKVQQQDQQMQVAERQRAEASRELRDLTALSVALRAAEARSASNAAAWKQDLSARPPAAKAGDTPDSKGFGDAFAKMLKDPAMKDMLRSQQKSVVNMMYTGLFKELNLTPDQRTQLSELLLDQQMRGVESAGDLFKGGEGLTNAAQSMAEQKKETDAKIRTLLGDDKFAQYEDYQKNLGERFQLQQFQQRLQDGPNAITDDQSRQLIALIKEERAKQPPVVADNAGQDARSITEMFSADTLEKQFQWQEELNKRVAERAGQLLSPAQLKEFTEFQAEQLKTQKLGATMARELLSGGKAAPAAGQGAGATPPAPTPPR
jgi:hypothetical protein